MQFGNLIFRSLGLFCSFVCCLFVLGFAKPALAEQALCDFSCESIGDGPMTKIAFTGRIIGATGQVFMTNAEPTFDFRLGYTRLEGNAVQSPPEFGSYYHFNFPPPHIGACYAYWGIQLGFQDNFSPATFLQIEMAVDNFTNRKLREIKFYVHGGDADHVVQFVNPIGPGWFLDENPALPSPELLSPTNWGNIIYQMIWSSGHVEGIPNVNTAVVSTNDCPPLVLQQTMTNGQVELRWPSAASGFVLQQSTNLATTNWSPASGTLSANGTNSVMSFPLTNQQTYYRLKRP